jgi:hypothetical protein
MAYTCDIRKEHSRRMLKKTRLLTLPTLARRDAPYPKQGRSERSLTTLLRGGWDDPNCARPTRAFSSRALREHRDRPSYPTPFFSILLDIWDLPVNRSHPGIGKVSVDARETPASEKLSD